MDVYMDVLCARTFHLQRPYVTRSRDVTQFERTRPLVVVDNNIPS